MDYKNSFFQLVHKEDGTYIKIFPARNGGKKVSLEELIQYLSDIKLEYHDSPALARLIAQSGKLVEMKLTPQQVYPENERIRIVVSPDNMTAIARFYPPSNKGTFMSREEIMDEIRRQDIAAEIQEKYVDAYLSNRQFCVSVPIAYGRKSVAGKDAEITYYFNTGADLKPRIMEDGRVDFHQLDNISHINAGDVLARLTPAVEPVAGEDIYGNPLPVNKVNHLVLRHGRNIHLSEDGLEMISDVSGHVTLADDQVFVSDTYEVPADVGPATGDITYDGNVRIRGNVLTGFSVKAEGNIIVEGAVEGAKLVAGGDIILSRGIQGMERGILEAGTDIIAKFIESSTAKAGKDVKADAIMNSQIEAGGIVEVTGRRGLITGGEVKSAVEINAKTLGSQMGTTTILEVGVDPALISRSRELEKKLNGLQEEKEKGEQIINLYKGKMQKGEQLSEDKLEQLKRAMVRSKKAEEEMEQYMEEFLQLKDEIEAYEGGRIVVNNLAYPGVKMTISNAVYQVKTETHYTQFVKENGEVHIKAI